MMKNLRAFTFVEMLIVIAIIAMLAAMLLPAIARAKARDHAVLHSGDKVEIIGLGVKGVVDRLYYSEATVLVQGNDGFPVKLEHVKTNILRKY